MQCQPRGLFHPLFWPEFVIHIALLFFRILLDKTRAYSENQSGSGIIKIHEPKIELREISQPGPIPIIFQDFTR